jgi:hypothetical protein
VFAFVLPSKCTTTTPLPLGLWSTPVTSPPPPLTVSWAAVAASFPLLGALHPHAALSSNRTTLHRFLPTPMLQDRALPPPTTGSSNRHWNTDEPPLPFYPCRRPTSRLSPTDRHISWCHPGAPLVHPGYTGPPASRPPCCHVCGPRVTCAGMRDASLAGPGRQAEAQLAFRPAVRVSFKSFLFVLNSRKQFKFQNS